MIFSYEANKTNETNKQRNQNQSKAVENEYVSDTFKTTEKDLDEVKAGMKLLGIDTLVKQSESSNGKHITPHEQLFIFPHVVSSLLWPMCEISKKN